VIERFEVGGLTVSIEQDEDAESPEVWGDTSVFLGRLRSDGNRRAIGREGYDFGYMEDHEAEADGSIAHPEMMLSVWPVRRAGDTLVLCLDEPERAYGAVYTPLLSELEQLATPEITPLELVEGLLETWNDWLSGSVYCFQVQDSEGDVIEVVGGFYVYKECKEDGKAAAEQINKRRMETA
jgi:hypothetical protein